MTEHHDLTNRILAIPSVAVAEVIGTGGGCDGLQVVFSDDRILFATNGDANTPEAGEGWAYFGLWPDPEAWENWVGQTEHLRAESIDGFDGIDSDALLDGIAAIAGSPGELELPAVFTTERPEPFAEEAI
jgi:hypothetical protein